MTAWRGSAAVVTEDDNPIAQASLGDIVIATLRDPASIGSPSLHLAAIVTEVLPSAENADQPIAAVALAGYTVQQTIQIPDHAGRPIPFPVLSVHLLTYSAEKLPQTWCWPEEHDDRVLTPHRIEAH